MKEEEELELESSITQEEMKELLGFKKEDKQRSIIKLLKSKLRVLIDKCTKRDVK